jgi:hypothetical protein
VIEHEIELIRAIRIFNEIRHLDIKATDELRMLGGDLIQAKMIFCDDRKALIDLKDRCIESIQIRRILGEL